MKKKWIFLIVGVIVLILAIAGFFAYSSVIELKRENELKAEMNEIASIIASNNYTGESINKRLDERVTGGKCGEVEDAAKSYLKDVITLNLELMDILNDDNMTKILTAENKKRFCLQWLYSRQIRRAPREGPPDLHAFTRRKEDFREKFHFAPQFLESRCCRRTGSGSPGFHGRLCKQQHRRILFGRHLYPRHLFGNRKRHRPGYRDHDL